MPGSTQVLARVLVAFVVGCAHARNPSAADVVQRRVETVEVALTQVRSGEFRVELRAPRPTQCLRFVRNANDWRARHWQLEPEFELRRKNGADCLGRRDRAPFQNASLVVPVRYVSLPKDYAPFSPFSDGGTLIYTGQFQFCPDEADCARGLRWRIRVTPRAGAHAIVAGRVHPAAVTFTDAGEGTNVYVGRAQPLNSSHFVAVVDPGLPAHLRAALDRSLPRMVDYLARRLGSLPAKPMLFASLDPNPPRGSDFSSQGGVLPGQIFLHLYGEKWAEPAARELDGFLPWFFAHEVAHQFQATGASGDSYPAEQAWIHEGGADAFAALTLIELAAASREYVAQRSDRAVDACARGLESLHGEPLNASAKAGAFGNYYTCGLVIQLTIHAEIQRSSSGSRDLFDVWARFLSRVAAGEPWNQDTFLDTASALGAPRAAAFARALATVAQPRPLDFLRAGSNTRVLP